MIFPCRLPIVVPCLLVGLALAVLTAPAGAQVVRGDLVVSGSPDSNPTGSGGSVTYSVSIKNDGTISARGVDVTIELPGSATFVKCSTSVQGQLCSHSAGIVTTTFYPLGEPDTFGAHSTETVKVTIKNPIVSQKTVLTLHAQAKADEGIGGMEPRAGEANITGTVVPEVVPVVFIPSLQQDFLACEQTVTPAVVGSDYIIQLTDHMACPFAAFALKIAASGLTLDLNGKKIVGSASDHRRGSVGILIEAGATDVTVMGGNTKGSAGIEYFDYCLMDEGGNTGLLVYQVRCFGARSAGFDIGSDGVRIEKVLVDRTVGGGIATAEPPGGVGIRASGNALIKESIVRRSRVAGIWADGALDPDGNGRVVQIELTQVQDAEAIGILLDGQFHLVKDTIVDGNGVKGTSTHGVVVNGADVVLDGVSVKQFAQHGIVVNGERVRIERSGVDAGGLDSFVILGANAYLSANSAKKGRHGFVGSGADARLDTNTAESIGGTGYIMTGARPVMNANRAKKVKGDGFSLAGDGGAYDKNAAESNIGTGLLITGQGGNFTNNSSLKSSQKAGWTVTGTGNYFNNNSADRNKGNEWEIGAGNLDGGANSKNGKGFTFGSTGGTFN